MARFNFSFVFVAALCIAHSLCDEFLSSPHNLPSRQACDETLTQQLSSEAGIYCPGSSEFANSTQRWSTLNAPTFRIAVEVATENDVAEVIKYANRQNISFLAVNNAHGAIVTTGGVKNGIMIWMHRLNSLSIAPDGQTATFGGGILDKEVTDGLWAAGKQTVTGGCECVSVIGPGLGGGHGFLQGRHGLVSDQFVSLTLVTANGTFQTVDAEHELWWAVRGAGHNFGIVTSITTRIYDVQHPTWAFRNFTFMGDKVEALYETLNQHLLGDDGAQPQDLFHYSYFVKNAAVDANNASITLFLLQEGVSTISPTYTAPLLALNPVSSFAGTGIYPSLPSWVGWHAAAPTCQNAGLANTRFPIYLQRYNITAQRLAYDLFSSTLNTTPAFNRSLVLMEGYAQQGVKARRSADSAFPFRGANLLVAPVVRFVEDGEGTLAERGVEVGEALREIFRAGSGTRGKRAYVNYAFGTEGVGEMYGEGWRVRRLRKAKREWDPEGKFGFYAPVG